MVEHDQLNRIAQCPCRNIRYHRFDVQNVTILQIYCSKPLHCNIHHILFGRKCKHFYAVIPASDRRKDYAVNITASVGDMLTVVHLDALIMNGGEIIPSRKHTFVLFHLINAEFLSIENVQQLVRQRFD